MIGGVGVVPGVDVAHFTRIAAHVPRGREEDAAHVHELAEGETDQQSADQRHMHEENGRKPFGRLRRERQHAHDEHLGLGHVHLVEIAHADARAGDPEQKKEREIVVGQGKIAQFAAQQPARQQKGKGDDNDHVGHEQARQADLHEAVQRFQPGQTDRNRLDEKPEMPHEDDKKAVVEQQREEPQPFGGKIRRLRSLGADRRPRVAEERTEEKDFKQHAAHHAGCAHGRVEPVRTNPAQGFFLPARGGNGEGHGRFRPSDDTSDKAADEDRRGEERKRHPQQGQVTGGRAGPGHGADQEDCHK